MATKQTGQPKGRPCWDLSKDDDRFLIAAFWATQITENQLKGDHNATRHAVAMTYAAIERGELMGSAENLAALSLREGKLVFRIRGTSAEQVSHTNGIKARADDIRRKARLAMESNYEWTECMAGAFTMAFYYPEREDALTRARVNCLAASEMNFFEQSLKPFIIGRFDPSKRCVFRLPDFMPNFV